MGVGTRFEVQVDQFAGVLQAILPVDYQAILLAQGTDATASGRRLILIKDDHGQLQLKVYLFDVPSGARGAEDLHFMYELQGDDGVEVYPVAVPADLLDALSNIHRRFE